MNIIETPSEAGAGTRGASLGPRAIFAESLKQKSNLFKSINWQVTEDWNHLILQENDSPNALNKNEVIKALNASYPVIKEQLMLNPKTLILSGDHSNASAGISACSDTFGADNLGLVWIDAHADLHSPFTTPSGNIHGMPLAAMLGEDNLQVQKNDPNSKTRTFWNDLKSLGNHKEGKLKPENMVFIAIRDLETPEWDLIHRLNIKYFEPKDIAELGIEDVVRQAKAHIEKTSHWYVSFDVDSIDPNISMGTGTPVALGLSRDEALACTQSFFNDKKTAVFEVTEINPLLDSQNKMASFVHDLMIDWFKG